MLNERLRAAHMVATPLHELEALIDQTLAKAAELATAMTKAPAAARVSRTVGQAAFDEIGLALAALTTARRHTVATHVALDETRQQLRMPVRAYGDEGEKVPPFTGAELAPGLRSVA